ncbi:conserved hypothetical protein [Nitrosococcus oceani ATCC 19707]|uniref:DUF4184 domain-containing protein n=3 Tax=Nitrosococcus oceani TaxID=1229 RepID=Q3JBB7_NITOC|nr:DUF4184 family protein [Nitrosococcus oceani]ABA57879.1 conserved hypothetical protein [Nitrosococcus oceani ATCC 19707]KFI19606.1 hypothetical protein IB75_07240 [Nitrosococcus oceani C-27]
MPATIIHLGLGVQMKSVVPQYFSFPVFVFTQLAIDMEAFYFLLQNESPVHRFLHTYIGATLIAFLAILIGRPLCQWGIGLWNARLKEKHYHWLYITPRISWKAAATAAIFGAYSHVLMDSIMHADIQPFAPFSLINGFWGAISNFHLHMFCIICGALGIIVLWLLWETREVPTRVEKNKG